MPIDGRSSSINWQGAEYQKNDTLNNLLDGKRIAFVGPAPHLKGSGMGKVIDSCDLVIRPGQIIRVPEELRADYGSRTDILIGSFNETEIVDYRSKLIEFENLKFVICSMISNTSYNAQEDFFKEISPMVITQNVDDKYLYRRFEEVGTVCNCGFSGILILLNYNIKELFVTGVDFYNMGKFGNVYYEHYYDTVTNAKVFSSNEGRIVTGQHARSDIHNQQAQINYFRKLAIENKHIITLDYYLKENLFKQ